MIRSRSSCAHAALAAAVVLLVAATTTQAGDGHRRRARRAAAAARPVVPTARVVDPVYAGRLGTFNPTPAILVQGNYPVGGGYSPLGTYGETTMSLYGPFSSMRTTTAPVQVYTRGYDGVVRSGTAISTSYPNLPALSPVAYPTRANNYYAPRVRENPAENSAYMWLDQN
ncbi:MAG: hypothetical protein ACYC61_28325 [Isosphaeraceae bacterium]